MPAPLSIVDAIRPLRVACAVAACGSTVAAAGLLHLSQSSVTRAVQSLEQLLQARLFERVGRGMVATPAGEALALRTQRALVHLALADPQARSGPPIRFKGDIAVAMPAGDRAQRLSNRTHDRNARHDRASWASMGQPMAWAGSRLATNLGGRHLTVLLALEHCGSETAGATLLGVSQSAVHQTLTQLEHMAGIALFHRARNGLRATQACEPILRACKLARSEWLQAGDEIASLRGQVQGRLLIGTLPFSTGTLLAETVDQVLRGQAGLHVSIIDGTFDALVHQLRQADIDLLVGALRAEPPSQDLHQQTLFLDRLAVVARAGHPLALRSSLDWSDLRDAAWIMPMPHTPAQAAFEQALQVAGMALPADSLRVNSAWMTQTILAQSERLALMSPRHVEREIAAGLLVLLPLKVQHEPRRIGLIRRHDFLPTPAVQLVLDTLNRVANRIGAQAN